ncbi:MAG: ParA family protein, partial [Ignavibacteriae bacterium]|nr:ParA family protein [Ignavibacteriota bacterium]
AKYHDAKILLLDLDPHANLAIGLGIGPERLETRVPVLKGEDKITAVIQNTAIPGLSIIPSNAYLDGLERTPEWGSDLYSHEKVRRSLERLDTRFDYCFIDTPPSLGWLTQSAFLASEYSVVCAIPEAFSIIALRRLKEFHESINAYHTIQVLGVILSFWDSRGAANQEFLEEIDNSFPHKLFSSKVRRDVAVSRAVLKGMSVMDYEPNSRAKRSNKIERNYC